MSALAVFMGGFFSIMLVSQTSLATVPVPGHKPNPEQETASDIEIIKYALKDFAKSLLDFGGPPVPPAKPFIDNDQPLSSQDLAHYKNIFGLQAKGRMQEADAEIAQLSNLRLRGYVLHQRYMHPTAYKSSFEELRNWMTLYADYPGADQIYQLAERKKPQDFEGKIKAPQTSRGIVRVRDPMMYAGRVYKTSLKRSAAQQKQVNDLKKEVLSFVHKGAPGKAEAFLDKDNRFTLMDEVEQDMLKARVASGYLYKGQRKQALDLAAPAAKRSGVKAPMAAWVSGLASWQDKKYKTAAKFFEVTASSPYTSGWTSAGGAYWAARSHMRTGNVTAVSKWLKKSMESPRTFYGLVATRALGHDFEFNWALPEYTQKHQEAIQATNEGLRAVSLIDAGQVHLAEAELIRINPGKNQQLREALLAYTGYAGMPALALRLGNYMSLDGQMYDAALYPKGPWQPEQGYKIDPALVHAIMRQESRFDPMAESYTGAVGLMQLMPRTARAVARNKGVSLTNPETNLELGQTYLTSLMDDRKVQKDLLSLLVAYNAGPGNLSRWRSQLKDIEDPLLFIELMPSKETRTYVERVLANYWIYRLREGLPTPSLDAVTSGQKAEYAYNEQANSFELADIR